MFLERPNIRLQLTVFGSLLLHAMLLTWFGAGKFEEKEKTLKLTEVEYQEEAPKPTELEKLMNKLAAPPKPLPPPDTGKVVEAKAAIAELEKTSFHRVVGLHAAPPALDKISEADLTHLAALPKFKPDAQAPPPNLAVIPTKKINLIRQEASHLAELDAKVIALDLPPADFGPDINRRGFQQPEMIIKKVKAERKQATTVDSAKRLSLSHDSVISGEVKSREILHKENPVVPRWLEEKGVEAEVVISFVVNPDGEVGDRLFVEKTAGYAELDKLAVDALKKYVFAPLPLNVKQVEQKGSIVIRFTFR